MSAPERFDDLVVLAALGELDADGWLELDALTADDPALAAELDEALDTAARLQAPFATEPPAGLRDAVLADLGSIEQVDAWEPPTTGAAVASDATPPAPEAGDDEPGTADRDDVAERTDQRAGADVVDLGERRRRRGVATLAAAAAVALLAGVGSFFVLGDDGGADRLAAVEQAPDAVERRLDGDVPITVYQSAAEGAIVVDAQGVPSIADDRVYVLWAIAEGEAPAAIGEFRPDADGSVSVRLDDVAPGDATLGLTEETAGQVDAPTEPIIALS